MAKYTEKRFALKKFPDSVSRLQALCEAVKTRDILALLQVYAEGEDLMESIPLANEHVSTRNIILEPCSNFYKLHFHWGWAI